MSASSEEQRLALTKLILAAVALERPDLDKSVIYDAFVEIGNRYFFFPSGVKFIKRIVKHLAVANPIDGGVK